MIVNDANVRLKRCYGFGAIALVLQLALAPWVAIGEGHPNLAIVYALVITLSGGGTTALVASFVAGIAFDLTSTGPVGLMALELVVASFLLGGERRDRMVDEPIQAFRTACVASVAIELVYQLGLGLAGQGASALTMVFLRWLPASLLDCLALVPCFLVFCRPRNEFLSLKGPRRAPKGRRYKL